MQVIRLSFVFKTFVLSIFEWGLKTGFTVKPVLRGHSKIDKTKILMTSGSFMKV